jgi:adenine-specific DNA-methyltransferase
VKSATSLVSSWIRGSSEKTDLKKQDDIVEDVTQRSGTSEDSVKEIIGEQAFSYPKPPSLFRELLRYATDADDIVVDFFAGSGTTAQAVLALNAEDDGRRRFILVSSREATIDNPDKNLCRDVCAERVRRVIQGYANVEGLGGNFAYLKTQRIGFEDLAYDLRPPEVWLALQVLHGLPLSAVRNGADLHIAACEGSGIAFCDHFTQQAEQELRAAIDEHHFLIVYSYAPDPIRRLLDGANNTEVRKLPDYLVQRFQA